MPLGPLDARVALYKALIRTLFDFADTIKGDSDNHDFTLMHDLQVKCLMRFKNVDAATDFRDGIPFHYNN